MFPSKPIIRPWTREEWRVTAIALAFAFALTTTLTFYYDHEAKRTVRILTQQIKQMEANHEAR